MKYRPSPDFLAALVIIALVFIACAYMIGAILFWQEAKAAETHTVCDTCVTDWKPDISHCFAPDETRELWDCIRHEEVDNEEAP